MPACWLLVVGNAKFELSPVMITNIRCSHIINEMRILNASPGFGTQLTQVEIKNFLGDSKLNIHLGTVDNKGDPQTFIQHGIILMSLTTSFILRLLRVQRK